MIDSKAVTVSTVETLTKACRILTDYQITSFQFDVGRSRIDMELIAFDGSREILVNFNGVLYLETALLEDADMGCLFIANMRLATDSEKLKIYDVHFNSQSNDAPGPDEMAFEWKFVRLDGDINCFVMFQSMTVKGIDI